MAITLASLRHQQAPKPPIALIFGPGGRGKTTLAAGAPNPVFLAVEDGLGTLNVPSWPIASYQDAIQGLEVLATQDHDFQTVVLDSVDMLEPLIWDQTCRDNGWTNIEAPGYGKGYVHALRYWREILDAMRFLRDRFGMICIMIGHYQIKRFDDPTNEPYDQYRLKLQDRAAGLIEDTADIVGFLNYRVTIQRSKQDFNETVSRGTGGEQRLLYLEGRPGFVAKNRYQLPPELELPTSADPGKIWAKLQKHLPEPWVKDESAAPEQAGQAGQARQAGQAGQAEPVEVVTGTNSRPPRGGKAKIRSVT